MRFSIHCIVSGFHIFDSFSLVNFSQESPPEQMVLSSNVKFNREISSSDGLDIVLNKCILAFLLHIVEVHDHKESNENGQAAKDKSMELSGRHLI